MTLQDVVCLGQRNRFCCRREVCRTRGRDVKGVLIETRDSNEKQEMNPSAIVCSNLHAAAM